MTPDPEAFLAPLRRLTQREREVLHLDCQGHTAGVHRAPPRPCSTAGRYRKKYQPILYAMMVYSTTTMR